MIKIINYKYYKQYLQELIVIKRRKINFINQMQIVFNITTQKQIKK
jgi:hypothetical protein